MTTDHSRGPPVRLCAAVALAALIAVPLTAPAASREPISAGIGLNDRQPRPEYPLKLVFATTRGHFLAAIEVTLFDASGKVVLKTHSSGPWLYLDVPAGTYRVRATRANGDAATGRLTVGGEGQSVTTLTWKAAR